MTEKYSEATKWGTPSYDADYLRVWNKNTDFLHDKKFIHAYQAGMKSGHKIGRTSGSDEDIHIEWRILVCCWAAQHAVRLQGDFVECGTNTGIMSLAICNYIDINKTGKNFYLFELGQYDEILMQHDIYYIHILNIFRPLILSFFFQSVFFDDVALNLLKAVADTTERRRVSWLSETNFIDEETAEIIPRTFEFNGSIIFITNLDFDDTIDRGSKLAPHLQAMMSRSHYVDLTMKTKQDYLVRIRQVVKQGLLSKLNWHEAGDVMRFIEQNSDSLRELSLRMVIKIANLRKDNTSNWERIARVTTLRN